MPEYAATDLFHHIIAQGVLTAGLISAVLGTKLPGPGTIYLAQELKFRAPVSPGDYHHREPYRAGKDSLKNTACCWTAIA